MLSSRHHSWVYLLCLVAGFSLGVGIALQLWQISLAALDQANATQIITSFISGAAGGYLLTWVWRQLPSACMHCHKPCRSRYEGTYSNLVYHCPHCRQSWDSGINSDYENIGE